MKVIVPEGEAEGREGLSHGSCRALLTLRLFMEGSEEASTEISGKLVGHWRVGWRAVEEVCYPYVREAT